MANMGKRPTRETVDLTGYSDLVVVYLGIRVRALAGIKTVLGLGPKIAASLQVKPDGLLLHENLMFSLRHVGMRQYWRDFEALEKWTRSEPHKLWWQQFLKDMGGTGFWHETYFMRGGMEAVYLDMEPAVGLARFAPVLSARGSMFSARRRAGLPGEANEAPVVEKEFYS
jgi:hypothetical protein